MCRVRAGSRWPVVASRLSHQGQLCPCASPTVVLSLDAPASSEGAMPLGRASCLASILAVGVVWVACGPGGATPRRPRRRQPRAASRRWSSTATTPVQCSCRPKRPRSSACRSRCGRSSTRRRAISTTRNPSRTVPSISPCRCTSPAAPSPCSRCAGRANCSAATRPASSDCRTSATRRGSAPSPRCWCSARRRGRRARPAPRARRPREGHPPGHAHRLAVVSATGAAPRVAHRTGAAREPTALETGAGAARSPIAIHTKSQSTTL